MVVSLKRRTRIIGKNHLPSVSHWSYSYDCSTAMGSTECTVVAFMIISYDKEKAYENGKDVLIEDHAFERPYTKTNIRPAGIFTSR